MKKWMTVLLTVLLTIYATGSILNRLSVSWDRSFEEDINVLKDHSQKLDLDLHSGKYLLVDLSDFEILYSKDSDVRMYPASLTKVLTMDTVLSLTEDLDELSFVTNQQVEDLIVEDASLAYLQRDYYYTLRDLLYALMLPSGADAAVALENYFYLQGIDLVEEMNRHAQEIGCTDSHFVNTTGLHDEDHYTTLNDLYLIVMDSLKHEEGRKILDTLYYTLQDETRITTGVRMVSNSKTDVRGGKTGYTPEAGLNIIVLYRHRGRSYVLLLGNAMGSYLNDEYWHFDDALTIFDSLY
jgi:D-alanyl-D-alanine carboxypeptidase (penicillin-binding protein 5/6)